MAQIDLIQELASNFNIDLFRQFLREVSERFRPEEVDLGPTIIENNQTIRKLLKVGHIEKNILQIGHINFDEVQQLIVVVGKLSEELTSRSSKARQYRIGKEILKQQICEAGIFVFHDEHGNFRFSLITANILGQKREFSYYRRYTYFVSPSLTNKTFAQQMGKAEFNSIETIQKAFSIEAVTNDFYDEFKPRFDLLTNAVKGEKVAEETKRSFALLFVIRLIFVGFVQKRGWLKRVDFIKSFWLEYISDKKNDTFYKRWLEPLFFEALNTPPGRKVMPGNNEFSKETEDILQMTPYLNGELFKRINNIDDIGLYLPDQVIGDFIEFLFQYNFTVEENNRYDEDLELNPEFLGIIFERLVNKADGAVYTPRIEVDYMCRLALVKWLEKSSQIQLTDLYYLFFREEDIDNQIGDANGGSQDIEFTEDEIRELNILLENITICDPAAGSGAFEVGMLQVLTEVLQYLQSHPSCPKETKAKDSFLLKKEIVANCLYGVEIKPWAVWINQLRLWLTLFIDMPDEYRTSGEPLLPSLNFKIRCGDSLVQQIAGKTFPIQEHANLSSKVKRKITELKKDKIDFFYNILRNENMIRQKEIQVFHAILDDEIARRENTRLFYEAKDNFSQESIFSTDTENQQEKETVFNQVAIDKLETEIAVLKEQKTMLKAEHPFIWNIEFAEIFFKDSNKKRQGFDIIIGNPPYVRQEDISDAAGRLSQAEYKSALIEMAKSDYEYFNKGKKIDGRSDLYTFFFLRSLRLLNPNGIHCFICSNSWLDAGYGVWLQEFLLNNVPMHMIIDNHAKRSFATAEVNTIITLFGAPDRVDQGKLVKFIAFKKPFEDVVYTEVLLEIESAKAVYKTDSLRIYPISARQLLDEGVGDDGLVSSKLEYIGDKWGGKYLRAPDIFFTLLEKGKGKFIKLKEVADIKFGIKTGCNEFFYLTQEKAKELQIEEKYLKSAILKTNEAKFPDLGNVDVSGYFFWCSEPKNRLKNSFALNYINYGENTLRTIKQGKNKGNTIIGFNNIESVKNRLLWYSIANREPAPIWWIIAHNDRSIAFKNKDNIPSDNFFEIIPKKKDYIEPIYLYLNSTIMTLFRELYGRSNFGGGVLKTQKPDLQKSFILHPELFTVNLMSIKDFGKIKAQSIFVECGIDPESPIPIEEQEPKPIAHRAVLDKIIFDALDLTEEERTEVYRAVCRLVWDRISKARSV